jgi:nifR3 family TIM-barrel protein
MSIPSSLQIAHLRFATPLVMAPMAGYSDLAFRMSVRPLGGIGLAFTEMLSPASLIQGKGRRRKALLATCDEDRPLGYQIYGARAAMLCDGARILAGMGVSLIDINMGCPQRKISGNGAGAGLLRDPEEAVRIAAAVVKSVPVPVTVKLRLGWDEQRLVAHEMAPALEEAGVAALTIHGRTRGQGYTGKADLEEIGRVVQAVRRIPVIGNGDVTSPESARRMFELTGCAAIMIGRGLLSNPWLAREIWSEFQGTPTPPSLDRTERMRFMRAHFERVVDLYGPPVAPVVFRKWIPQYGRKLCRNRHHMVSLLQITDADRMRQAIDDLGTAGDER